MAQGPLQNYRIKVEAGEIDEDPAQLFAVETLQLLANKLGDYKPARSPLSVLFNLRNVEPPKGLYIFGDVGRGKTMLMDLFFETIAFEPKRRLHFHEFMGEIHELIAHYRNNHQDGDPIPLVARDIAQKAMLLCFDEFHVTDITDAMILGRLFSALFEEKVIIVATSNAAPHELYRDGLNRQLFLPFIDLIDEKMEILELVSARDYRLEKLRGQDLYFSPLGAAADQAMDAAWARVTGGSAAKQKILSVKGRSLTIPQSAMGAARIGFDDLCAKPLGAHDYLAIARAFHTVLIEHIPQMGPHMRNEARRFITLIDTFYDSKVRLIASAEAEPDALYQSGTGADLFQRTASRLVEMRSEAYLAGDNAAQNE